MDTKVNQLRRQLHEAQQDLRDARAARSRNPRATGTEGDEVAGFEDFFDAYIQAAVWSSTAFAADEGMDSSGENDIPMDEVYYGVDEDFDPDCLAKQRADCQKFWGQYGSAVVAAEENPRSEYSNAARAGHDFWLTRKGHGAGFWDGDWPEPLATKLTKASKGFGEVWLFGTTDGDPITC